LGQLISITAALSVIIALRYLLVAGGAYWFFWLRGRACGRRLSLAAPNRARVAHEIKASLVSAPIYAFPAAAAYVGSLHGVTKIYQDPSAYGLWWLPASAAIYLLAHDAFYYWLHRAMHHRLLFAVTHRGHHLSRDPSPFASFSFDPAEAAMTAWFLPALTLIIPIHIGVALTLLTLMTITAVLNHAGWEVWPTGWIDSPVGRYVITARHHDVHHKRYGCNYGLYFRFWDKWAGTDRS